jgi:hypothetical protein
MTTKQEIERRIEIKRQLIELTEAEIEALYKRLQVEEKGN